MKKSLIAFAAMSAATSMVHAQSSVTMYGSIDAGIRNVTNVNAAGDSRLSMNSNGNFNSNRLGFKGAEDLGGGMRAHFSLELGFNSGTGALNNNPTTAPTSAGAAGTVRLFQRSAFVGIGGSWGTLDFGRQVSVSAKTMGLYDPFVYKYVQLVPLAAAAAGSSSATSHLGGFRFDNDIQYIGKFGPFTALAEYSLGETAGDFGRNSAQAFGASYVAGPLLLAGAYTKKTVTPLGVVASALSPKFDYDAYTVGAAYTFGKTRISGGYNEERLETVSGLDTTSKITWAGVAHDLTPAIQVTGGYYQTKASVGGNNGKRGLFIVGATYALSKRTNLYASIDRTRLDGIARIGGVHDQQAGFALGVNHLF